MTVSERATLWNKVNLERRREIARNWARRNKIQQAIYYKKYAQLKRKALNAKEAKRRATKLKATPQWACLEIIKQFYLNCPRGYHVDHIIPLKGKNVCGLHVIDNLQYLPALDNIRKGNKF